MVMNGSNLWLNFRLRKPSETKFLFQLQLCDCGQLGHSKYQASAGRRKRFFAVKAVLCTSRALVPTFAVLRDLPGPPARARALHRTGGQLQRELWHLYLHSTFAQAVGQGMTWLLA